MKKRRTLFAGTIITSPTALCRRDCVRRKGCCCGWFNAVGRCIAFLIAICSFSTSSPTLCMFLSFLPKTVVCNGEHGRRTKSMRTKLAQLFASDHLRVLILLTPILRRLCGFAKRQDLQDLARLTLFYDSPAPELCESKQKPIGLSWLKSVEIHPRCSVVHLSSPEKKNEAVAH